MSTPAVLAARLLVSPTTSTETDRRLASREHRSVEEALLTDGGSVASHSAAPPLCDSSHLEERP